MVVAGSADLWPQCLVDGTDSELSGHLLAVAVCMSVGAAESGGDYA
jgi:hypothetical protein